MPARLFTRYVSPTRRSLSLVLASALVAAAAAASVAPATADVTEAADQRAPYKITLKSSTKEAVADEGTVKLTGKVRPKAPGQKVLVQLQYDGKDSWNTIGKATIKKNGSYRYVDEPTSRLERSYRVVKAGDAKATKGTSRERDVQVYAWDWLVYLEPSAQKGTAEAFPMPINGDDYANTLHADRLSPTAFAEYTLGRDCLEMDATFGLSDRTETGGQASIAVTADGKVLYSRAFNLGESEPRTLDVDGVFRLRLDFAQLNGTPATEASAGAARVLCD